MQWLFFAALMVIAPPLTAQTCDAGFNAFQSTVYAKVMRDCRECHGGQKFGAPPFASADPRASYNQLLNYMNFTNREDSLLVIRAGNGHCGKANCQAASGQEMSKLADQWWRGGEKSCERYGHLFSQEIALPAALPGIDEGFQTLNVELGSVKPELTGVTFQIQAQNFLAPSGVTKGAYRFRSPRFLGGAQALYVKDIKILINGVYDSAYNAYSTINRTVPFFKITDDAKSSTPTLSSEMLVVVKDGSDNPKLTVSFVDIGLRDESIPCVNENGFRDLVQPLLTSNKCASCHHLSAASIGEQVFDCSAATEQVCRAASSLVDPDYFLVSPLIAIPAQGTFKHPQFSDSQREEYVKALKAWLKR